jgi:RNA polymerase sigma-70 factor (ECF subfamily)
MFVGPACRLAAELRYAPLLPIGVRPPNWKLEFDTVDAHPIAQYHPGEPATRTMTTQPHHGEDMPMATTVDHLAGGDSPLASRNPEMTARFVNEALPYLNQLNDRARRLARNAVDTEDLMQETMLRAHVGFHTYSGGTNVRAWLFRIMSDTYVNGLRRAQHRPCDYLTDHITDRQLAARGPHPSRGPLSAEPDALNALCNKMLADALMTSPVQFRPAVHYRRIAGLRCRGSAEGMACREGTVMSRLHRGRQRIQILFRTRHGRA